jgi:hypothetical protein
MTKRELTTMLFQSWKKLGISRPRASTFPPIGVGKQILSSAYEMLREMLKDAA